MRTKVGIIGLGFVGSAIYESFKNQQLYVKLARLDPAKGFNTTYDDIKNFDAVFICVPSPQNKDGSADTSILETVLKNLEAVKFTGVIISKVTAPPNVYKTLQENYNNLVHVPEFLTAANARDDYENGTFAIIGGKIGAYRKEAERVVLISQTNLKQIIHCSIEEASLTKYGINSFLATKVVFMNELARLAESSNCNWNLVKELMSMDNRIGNSHMQVPGPDGQYGFGGYCFPKDTAALLKFAQTSNVDLSVLDAAVKKNLLFRLT